jgi:pyrroline-5-carboxylate reductase
VSETLGIIGTGALARYCVAGLRNAGGKRRILLSPRNAQIAAELARDFACEVMADNRAVADGAEIVLLATRPAVAESALGELALRDDQLLISVVAGLPLTRLRELAANPRIVRSMPLCCAEVNAGAMPLWPEEAQARALLSQLGEVIAVNDEQQFELAFVASCANGWFHRLFAELEDWLCEAGFERARARRLALQAAHGASSLDLARPDIGPRERAELIATPGTYTREGLDTMLNAGASDALREAFDLIRTRIKGSG